jgi:hypothetical protein
LAILGRTPHGVSEGYAIEGQAVDFGPVRQTIESDELRSPWKVRDSNRDHRSHCAGASGEEYQSANNGRTDLRKHFHCSA